MTRPIRQVLADGSVIQALRGRCGGCRVVMTVKCSPGEVGFRATRVKAERWGSLRCVVLISEGAEK